MPDPPRKLTKQSITISLTVIWLVRWQGHASNRHGWDTERAGVKLRTGSLPGDGWYIVHYMCWKRSLRGALCFLIKRQILAGRTGRFEIKISQRRFHQSRCVSSISNGLHWTLVFVHWNLVERVLDVAGFLRWAHYLELDWPGWADLGHVSRKSR